MQRAGAHVQSSWHGELRWGPATEGVAREGSRAGEGPTAHGGEGMLPRCQGPRGYLKPSKFFLVFLIKKLLCLAEKLNK